MGDNLLAYFFLLLEVLEQSLLNMESPEFMMVILVESSVMGSFVIYRGIIMLHSHYYKTLLHGRCSLVFIENEKGSYREV